MDTKLKNLTRKQMEMILVTLVFLFFECFTFADICYNYQRCDYYWSVSGLMFYRISSVILALVTVILGIVSGMAAWGYIKKYRPWENLKPHKIDRCRTEILILLVLLSGGLWMDILSSQDVYLMGGLLFPLMIVNNVVEVIQMTMIIFLIAVFLLGGILLLIRQKLLGIFPETSVILTKIREFRMRTPLEILIQKKKKYMLIFTALLLVCAAVLIIPSGYGPAVASVFLLLIVYILFWGSAMDDKTTKEVGILLEHIRTIYAGENLENARQLPKESLFQEASEQLKNIHLTMQKSVEKQVQAERLKIDLITNMSHDLKTPLTSMVGYTDLLKKEELSDEARDYVEIISLKQEQLKNMIQDVFELSKATSGVEQLNMECLDMRKLLEQTLGDMEDNVKDSGLDIRTKFSENPLPFMGDNNKMYRVVQNLLGNALKYSLAGTRVYLEAGEKNGHIFTEIKNISAYEMDFSPEEITERFVRGDKSRTTEGHGLGLAIASSFVHNMGGTMQISIDGDLFKVFLMFPIVSIAPGRM
ncbi:MAG: HAMP domain-containing histidine kinase [Eubacterium sp.]|nr:HAMP domain-containing histidine kinase [Eubacterium sp.]